MSNFSQSQEMTQAFRASKFRGSEARPRYIRGMSRKAGGLSQDPKDHAETAYAAHVLTKHMAEGKTQVALAEATHLSGGFLSEIRSFRKRLSEKGVAGMARLEHISEQEFRRRAEAFATVVRSTPDAVGASGGEDLSENRREAIQIAARLGYDPRAIDAVRDWHLGPRDKPVAWWLERIQEEHRTVTKGEHS